MKCYFRDGKPTSVKHSPAKSFFPADKWVNLITVPSCSLHNEDTSANDEYVRNIIAMALGNNPTGVSYFTDKGIRSLSRSIGLMKATTGKNSRIYYTEPHSEELKLSYAFQVDRMRFDRVIRKTAYGIFFLYIDNRGIGSLLLERSICVRKAFNLTRLEICYLRLQNITTLFR
jgi:hypothetical protein